MPLPFRILVAQEGIGLLRREVLGAELLGQCLLEPQEALYPRALRETVGVLLFLVCKGSVLGRPESQKGARALRGTHCTGVLGLRNGGVVLGIAGKPKGPAREVVLAVEESPGRDRDGSAGGNPVLAMEPNGRPAVEFTCFFRVRVVGLVGVRVRTIKLKGACGGRDFESVGIPNMVIEPNTVFRHEAVEPVGEVRAPVV
jgi:hypothetical protein